MIRRPAARLFATRLFAAAAAFAAAAVAAAPPAAAQQADRWQVDHEESRLGFTAFQGGAFQGRFTDWQADIRFAPDALDDSSVTVTVNVASIETGSDDRDETATEEPWFDVAEHPRATFAADTFREIGDGRYEAVGELTMKGVGREVVLPFDLEIEGDTARVDGDLSLNRTNWNLGTGDFSTEEIVGFEVRVEVELVAERVAD
jgi:polyisoprenoid-binding protein YceI